MEPEHSDATQRPDAPEDFGAMLAIVAECLAEYGRDYLENGRIKARQRPLRRLTLPYYMFVARRMNRLAKRVAAVADRADEDDQTLARFADVLESLPLSEKRRSDFLSLMAQRVAADRPRGALGVFDFLMQAQSVDTFIGATSTIAALAMMQAEGKFEEALDRGRGILERPGVTDAMRRRILAQPAMLLGACDLVPEPAPRPAWARAGRVAYVAASSLPYSVAGYTTRTEGVVLGYMGLGLEMPVVTRPPFPFNIQPDLDPASVADVETVNGVDYHRLKRPLQRGLSPPDYIAQAAEAMQQKLRALEPEMVIAASNHTNALPALIAARRLGLSFAYEVRGFWELSRVARDPDYAHTADFAVSQRIEAFVASQADRVLTLTAQMHDDLVDRGVPADRIALMPNGVTADLVATLSRDAALARDLGVPDGVPVIGYIGSILEYEGLQDLAQACAGLAGKGLDFRFLLVGAEKPDLAGRLPITEAITAHFARAGIGERLIMPGRVPFADVPRYYSLIDIAPIPRRPYAVAEVVSPIKPIEAMAMAKAVVVSDVEVLKDLVLEGETGLTFRKGDAADLERVLERLLRDADLRHALQRGGQDFVRANRTWPVICAHAADHLGLAVDRSQSGGSA